MLEGMKKRYMKLNSMGYSEYGRQADVIGRLTQTGKPWLRTLKEPYTAMIQFTDGRIHTSPLDCFVCRFFENNTAEYSFYEPEMFIGALLGSGLDFRILKPNWLREYLKDRLERILEVL
ncbi:MAG: hypothetical protein IKI93_12770 [Clostridia bacterium]|nr:hypothetical protein [Clostridia bacterium]